jgi:hypothetical protein
LNPWPRLGTRARDRCVVSVGSRTRTQNGHIRNDTRDASRRIFRGRIRPICRENYVASDRACTRVTLRNLHGKEGVDGSSPSEGFDKVPANWHLIVVCSLNARTHSGHIRGTRDALRRFATSADTVLSNRSDEFARQAPSKKGDLRCLSRREADPLPAGRGSRGHRGRCSSYRPMRNETSRRWGTRNPGRRIEARVRRGRLCRFGAFLERSGVRSQP